MYIPRSLDREGVLSKEVISAAAGLNPIRMAASSIGEVPSSPTAAMAAMSRAISLAALRIALNSCLGLIRPSGPPAPKMEENSRGRSRSLGAAFLVASGLIASAQTPGPWVLRTCAACALQGATLTRTGLEKGPSMDGPMLTGTAFSGMLGVKLAGSRTLICVAPAMSPGAAPAHTTLSI